MPVEMAHAKYKFTRKSFQAFNIDEKTCLQHISYLHFFYLLVLMVVFLTCRQDDNRPPAQVCPPLNNPTPPLLI
jgi:hypothetical protein